MFCLPNSGGRQELQNNGFRSGAEQTAVSVAVANRRLVQRQGKRRPADGRNKASLQQKRETLDLGWL